MADGTSGVLCIEAAPKTTTGSRDEAASRLVDEFIQPTISIHGGSAVGVLDGRLVARFPGLESARRCARDLVVSHSTVPGSVARVGVAADPTGGALPSTEAVVAATRNCVAAAPGTVGERTGATPATYLATGVLPLAAAGLATLRWWSPSDSAAVADSPPEADQDAPPVADAEAEQTDPTSDGDAPAQAEPDLRHGEVLLFFTDPQQEEIAVDSLERFAAAGLDLPDGLEIHFHDDLEACGGHARAIAVHGLESERIEMCTSHDFTLRHELGHIWAWEHLDDADREALVTQRGLPTWSSTDYPWGQRGTEHAAHVIAWGLGDAPIALSEIPTSTFESLTESFELLTGRQPLHHTDWAAGDTEEGTGHFEPPPSTVDMGLLHIPALTDTAAHTDAVGDAELEDPTAGFDLPQADDVPADEEGEDLRPS